MKLLLITDCFVPSQLSVAILMRDLASELAVRGHGISVLVPDSSLSEPVRVEQYSSEAGSFEVVRVRSGKTKGAGMVRRGLNELSMSFRMWHSGRKWFAERDYDGIVFYSPSIFFGPLVGRLKALYGCKAYLILRDIFPKWAVDVGLLKKGPLYYLFRMFERLQYSMADEIGVQSPANLTYFRDEMKAVMARKHVLFNWTASKQRVRRDTGFREQHGLHGKYLFVYGGNLGRAQGLSALTALAEGFRGDDAVRIVVAGDGTESEWLTKTIRDKALSNLVLVGALPESEYEGLLCECNCGVITLNYSISSHNIPGKLLSYLSAGLPTAAYVNRGNDLKQIVEENHVGYVIDSGNVNEFVDAARRIRASSAEFRTKTESVLQNYFSCASAADHIEEYVVGVANKQPEARRAS